MKKSLYCACVLLIISLTACNIGIPSGLKVKTKANYNFCIANKAVDLDETYGLDKLAGSLPEDGNVQLYNYTPAGTSAANKKQLLMAMSFQKIPLDFDSFLTGLSFNSEGMSVPLSFEIPAISMSQSQDLNLDDIKNGINAVVAFEGSAAPESDLAFFVEDGFFEKVVYSSGKITINCNQPDGVIVTLVLANGNRISAPFTSKKAELTLPAGAALTSGATESSKMHIIFTGDDFVPGEHFTAVMDENSVVESVHGFTLTVPQTQPFTESIPVELPEVLKNLTVGKGSLELSLKLPARWSGVTSTLSGNLTGAITKTITGNVTDLKDASVESGDLNFSGNVEVGFDNATLYFGSEIPEFTLKCGIENLETVEIEVEDGLFTKDIAVSLPEEACSMLDSIIWKPSGVSISMVSNLSEENQIKLKSLKSEFFGIDEGESAAFSSTAQNFYCSDNKETAIGAGTKVDFAFELNAFNYNSTRKTITLKNMDTGKTYNAELTVEPKIDWFKVNLNSGAFSGTQKEVEIKPNFDKSSLLAPIDTMLYGEDSSKSIGDVIKIKKIPLYLHCNIPETLGGLSFSGYLTSYLEKDGNPVPGSEKSILGSEDDQKTLSVNRSFRLVKNDKGDVISDVSKAGDELDITDLIWGEDDGSFVVSGKVGLGGGSGSAITLVNPAHKTEVGADEKVLNSSENNTIEITAYVPLMLDFEVSEDIEINVLDIMKVEPDKDLLGRSERVDNDSTNEYLGFIRSVDLTYAPSIIPVGTTSEKPISIDFALYDNGVEFTSQSLKVTGGKLELNPADIMNAYPLTASLKVIIPKGDFYICSKMILEARFNIGIHTDAEIDIFELAKD